MHEKIFHECKHLLALIIQKFEKNTLEFKAAIYS